MKISPPEYSDLKPRTQNIGETSESELLNNVNIVHVTPVYKPAIGGIGTIVQNLAQMTCRNTNARVRVLFSDSEWYSRDKRRRQDGAVEVIHVKTIKIWFVRIPIGIAPYLAEADIVHIHDPFFSLVALAAVLFARREAKIVMSTHGGFFHTNRWMALKKVYFNSVCRGVATTFSAIAAVSGQDFRRFAAISKRVVLIENGVEIEKFANDDPLPVHNNFLFVGTLSKNKNIEGLIDVFAKLSESRKDITLDVIGEDIVGLWRTIIKKKLEKNPVINLNYHGSLDDKTVVGMMKRTKFFMLASTYEGFGIAVVEAMAAGRIPIVSDIVPMRDLITNNQNGFLVDFADVEGAAAAIEKILKLPSSNLEQIAAASRLTSRRFSWNSVGNAYFALYEKCLLGNSWRLLKKRRVWL
jgi:alpha-1,3-mannosyltransferase